MGVVFIEAKSETVYREGKNKRVTKKVEEVINVARIKEQLAKRDWLRDAHRDLDKYYNGRKFEDWYRGNLYDTVKDDISGAGRLDPQETARQFQAGQLVRRPGRENRACVGIVVGLVQPKWAGKEVSPTFIQVMWPDGDIDEISSDDLLLCKPLPEVV